MATQQKSQPYGFPEIEPLPSRNIWEPKPNLPSKSLPDFNIYSDKSETPAIDAFYEGAMNPPVRQRPSALRMVGTGLLSALQGSTGQESRVPLYNERGKVVGSREAGFWESLGNKPFNVPQAKSILDIPHEAKVEDYERGMKGLGAAANIESQYPARQALARQREAAAAATPRRVDIAQQNADRQTYLAQLKDLPDSEKMRLLQEGKIQIQDIRDAASMQRVNVQQAGATTRTGMQQAGATERTGMQQAGATERTGMQQTGANTRNQANIAAAMERVGAQQAGATERANIGSKSTTLPSQQKTQQLLKANEVLNQHPEWDDFIEVDPNTGVVHIAPEGTGKSWWSSQGGLDKTTRDQIYSSIYGTAPPQTSTQTPPPAKPPAKATTTPPATKSTVEMITPDGKGTRMVSADQVELAKKQGFKPKGK